MSRVRASLPQVDLVVNDGQLSTLGSALTSFPPQHSSKQTQELVILHLYRLTTNSHSLTMTTCCLMPSDSLP